MSADTRLILAAVVAACLLWTIRPRQSSPEGAVAGGTLMMSLRASASTPPGPIAPGTYRCQISEEYRFRPCTVSLGADRRTYIDMPGGLLHLRGTLRGDGRDVILEAVPQGDRPYGCASCADGGVAEPAQVYPRSRGCIPLVRQADQQCRSQRAVARLRYASGRWRGTMEWKVYYNTYDYLPDGMNRVTGFTVEPQRIMVTIRR